MTISSDPTGPPHLLSAAAPPLAGWTILVVEPRFLIAQDVAATVGHAGATVVGPVSRKAEAFAAIAQGPGLQGAILATVLADGRSFGLARRLMRCRIPTVFHTGMAQGMIPATLAGIPYCCKPCPADTLLAAMLDADRGIRAGLTRAA